MKILIKTVPNAKQNKIQKISNFEYKVWLTAPAVEGKANDALIKLLSKHFNIAKSKVEIKKGGRSRNKIVSINS